MESVLELSWWVDYNYFHKIAWHDCVQWSAMSWNERIEKAVQMWKNLLKDHPRARWQCPCALQISPSTRSYLQACAERGAHGAADSTRVRLMRSDKIWLWFDESLVRELNLRERTSKHTSKRGANEWLHPLMVKLTQRIAARKAKKVDSIQIDWLAVRLLVSTFSCPSHPIAFV